MKGIEPKIIARYNDLKSRRSQYDPTLQDIADYILINRGNFNRSTNHVKPETNKVFCNYAIEALNRLTSIVYNGLFNPGSKWFNLHFKKLDENNVQVRRWLDSATNHMLEVFNSTYSNFPTANYESLLSWASLGTSCMYVEESEEGSIKFINIHLSQVYFSSNVYGELDTVMRVVKMKPINMIERFGVENVHPNVLNLAEERPNDELDILHYVRPKNNINIKDTINPGKLKNFNFISTYLDLDHCQILSEGGYYKQPYIISRFSVFSCDDWGRSPAWDCLNEVKSINVMQKDMIKATQLQATPPIMTVADALQEGVELAPGMILDGTLGFDGSPAVMPLQMRADLGSAEYLMEKMVSRIRESFYVDQLYYKDGTPATATEIQDKQLTRSAMLAPIINRLQHEHLNKLIEIVFDIEYRAGRIEKINIDLGTHRPQAEYLTPLANQQKLEDVNAIQRYFAFVAPMAQADPTVLDAIKFAETGLYSALSFGIPGDLIRSPEELAQLMQRRQMEARMAQQQQMMSSYASQLTKTPPVQ